MECTYHTCLSAPLIFGSPLDNLETGAGMGAVGPRFGPCWSVRAMPLTPCRKSAALLTQSRSPHLTHSTPWVLGVDQKLL